MNQAPSPTFAEAIQLSPAPLFIAEFETGRILSANRGAAALIDCDVKALEGQSGFDFFMDEAERRAIFAALRERGRVENLVARLRTAKNWPFWALLSAQLLKLDASDCCIVGLSDITAQKVAEAALRRSEQSIRALFEAAPVAMVLARAPKAEVILANQRASDLFAVPADEIPGISTLDFYVDGEDRVRVLTEIEKSGKVDGYVVKLRKRDGIEFWGLMSSRTIEFENETALMAGISDITPQKELEAQLWELATRDFLTSAYNRRHFLELGSAEVQRARRGGTPLSLCILDVDHFKRLNDSFGHAVGDDALKLLSEACKRSLRAFDVFARFGGEEFVILYPGTNLEGAWVVTERVRQTVESAVLRVEGRSPARLTVSAGVAELLPGEELESLLRRADDALYSAKGDGRNRSQRALAS